MGTENTLMGSIIITHAFIPYKHANVLKILRTGWENQK